MLSVKCSTGTEPDDTVCAGTLKPIETYYRGCHFRSRIEARWVVFFETLGIKWWHEPEGFALRFDYEKYAAQLMDTLDMTEDELLQDGIPQTYKHLDGKEYRYLPDIYLPELRIWLEIKGPNPTREEIEKAFLLDHMVYEVATAKLMDAKTDDEFLSTFVDELRHPHGGTYIIYGDIPWPFPEKGNIFGWGASLASGSTFFDKLAEAESDAGESGSKATEYRKYRRLLLMGKLQLCWQECPLCLKIGVAELGKPYCRDCTDDVAEHIFSRLAGYRVMGGAEPSLYRPAWSGGRPVTPEDLEHVKELNLPRDAMMKRILNPADLKAMNLTKDLMNLDFFTSGHKSPRLQKAYSAARSARFEHGESP
jgi:hypothetical protein